MGTSDDEDQTDGELTLLQATLENLFSIVQTTYNAIGPCIVDNTKKGLFLAKAATLDITTEKYETTLKDIQRLKLAKNTSYVPNFQQFTSLMDLYGQIKFHEKKFSSDKKTEASTSGMNVTVAQPKLPPLELPSFDGNVSDWPTFYETFKSIIHSNQTLSNDQKVQYLVSKLKNQALGVCAGIPPVGSNYDLIWNSLVERYQDVRYLASYYVDNILNFKNITHESHVSYTQFIDKLGTSVVALQALNIDNLAEYLLYAICIKKVDTNLSERFESKILEKESMPKFAELLQFVKDKVKVMERTAKTPCTSSSVTSVKKWQNKPVSLVSSYKQVESLCPICKKDEHLIYQCEEFNKCDAYTRFNKIKSLKLCFNCFSSQHSAKTCPNNKTCKVCKFRHHTTLHLPTYNKPQNDRPMFKPTQAHKSADPESHTPVAVTAVSHTRPKSLTVLLSTVKVNIPDSNGDMHTVRMLLDSGSMSHFITTKCCHKLGLPMKKISTSVGGIGTTRSEVKGVTTFTLHSRFDTDKSYIVDQAYVVTKITNKLPICPVDVEKLCLLQDINPSDDEFHIPGEIEGLIGAELFSQIYGNPKKSGDQDSPTVIESTLGDIIMGNIPVFMSNIQQGNESICGFVEAPLESLVQKFWALEEVPTPKILCEEDTKCEKIFCDTIYREDDGRYSVALPFKSDPDILGDSYKIAEKRFLRLEQRLSSNPEVKEQYRTAITEYMKEGYAVPSEPKTDKQAECYMVHHAVFRPERVSTKVRVVFDLSCPTSNGISLNDILFTGPTLYNDLFELLVKFRMFPIAALSDVKKMFLQVYVREEDRRFQKFLWRDSPQEELQTFEMQRVVFGMKPSPYLAQRVLRQLAEEEEDNYPNAATEIKNNFYMDDYLSSFLDEEQAVSTFAECVKVLQKGGFELTKLASNNVTLLESVSEKQRLMAKVEWDKNSTLKVLGTQYCPAEDKFFFTVNIQDSKCTKRNILSTTARIFDVLGLLSPVTILAKLFIKELWLAKIDWDECPPPSVQEKWNRLISELPLLNQLQIPRHLLIAKNTELSVIGFCDASEKAIGACIYVHVTNSSNEISSRLLCARSKVAPVKYVTIPRLELCSALLLSKLMSFILKVFNSRYEVKHVLCFSDSTVALSWIASQPLRWKTFVANRVSKIQENVSAEKWFHVQGVENPADCLSRGIFPQELIEQPLWLKGPQWMTTPIPTWNLTHITEDKIDAPEEKVTVLLTSRDTREFILLDMASNVSHWNKLLRAVAYVLKFCRIIPRGNISVQDLEKSEEKLLQELQESSFDKDIDNLKKNKSCSNDLMKLRPFMDKNLLRCGGRLSNADHLAYEHIHPVVLPKKHHVVDLLIDYHHKNNFHTGPHLVIAILRTKYWILGCRDTVRRRLQKCNTCFKNNPKPLFPVMGDLPKPRVEEATKAFLNTGVDYAGPLSITITKTRGAKSQKAYLCLFICLSTKAVHIELASDLSTPMFLLALRRFIARRGAVKNIYSDQGTNFIGAANVLNDLYAFVASNDFNEHYKEELLKQRIEFHFNPPASPHHGGLWESNIRQIKNHLHKAIGSQVLTFEEMYSLTSEIEFLLNRRPLVQISSDSGDPVVLTPAHFLLQEPHGSLTHNLDYESASLGVRYKLITQLLHSFWKRWSMEYLSSLQTRQKWFKNANQQLCVGLLVLIKSDNAPVSCWPLGRVIQICPGKDGVSRVALIQTKSGTYKRPAVKLCPLPSQ
uniref:Integrase catalytic domain-containing protein n=1 Tax=Cacopsylla melanoneura TaxID=428564 RepID=A0A8D8WZP0_9HEMI